MTWRSDGAARTRGWVRELSAHTSVLAWLCPFERTPRGRVVYRHSPQLPRALLGRLRMCRKAGGRAARHAGGWTVAGTRAWGAWVTCQERRAGAARLCCQYPKDEGRPQELPDTLRERACLIALSPVTCQMYWEHSREFDACVLYCRAKGKLDVNNFSS